MVMVLSYVGRVNSSEQVRSCAENNKMSVFLTGTVVKGVDFHEESVGRNRLWASSLFLL